MYLTPDSRDRQGPFIYYKVLHYDFEFMVIDIVLLAIRAFLTFLTAILYCPDYFEYFIAKFDESYYMRASNPEYQIVRSSIDLAIGSILTILMVV